MNYGKGEKLFSLVPLKKVATAAVHTAERCDCHVTEQLGGRCRGG